MLLKEKRGQRRKDKKSPKDVLLLGCWFALKYHSLSKASLGWFKQPCQCEIKKKVTRIVEEQTW
jgi:hypothetical protein